jgi:hypothetical protein
MACYRCKCRAEFCYLCGYQYSTCNQQCQSRTPRPISWPVPQLPEPPVGPVAQAMSGGRHLQQANAPGQRAIQPRATTTVADLQQQAPAPAPAVSTHPRPQLTQLGAPQALPIRQQPRAQATRAPDRLERSPFARVTTVADPRRGRPSVGGRPWPNEALSPTCSKVANARPLDRQSSVMVVRNLVPTGFSLFSEN